MESVPRAVATGYGVSTGSGSDRVMIEEDRDPVVIAPGTDLIDKERPNAVVTTFTLTEQCLDDSLSALRCNGECWCGVHGISRFEPCPHRIRCVKSLTDFVAI